MTNKGFTVRLPMEAAGRIQKFCKANRIKKTEFIRSAILHGIPQAEKKFSSLNPLSTSEES